MEKYLITIQICSSCAKINAGAQNPETFCNAVQEDLRKEREDFEWRVESTSCMKVCPGDRITMTVASSRKPTDRRLAVSKAANEEAVVKEALTFFRPKAEVKT